VIKANRVGVDWKSFSILLTPRGRLPSKVKYSQGKYKLRLSVIGHTVGTPEPTCGSKMDMPAERVTYLFW